MSTPVVALLDWPSGKDVGKLSAAVVAAAAAAAGVLPLVAGTEWFSRSRTLPPRAGRKAGKTLSLATAVSSEFFDCLLSADCAEDE